MPRLLPRSMMTAEERVVPRVPGGGMPQETDKSKPVSSLEDPLLDAVDGTFISALLQHALDNLSATASTSTGEEKAEALDSEAGAPTVPPVCSFSTGNPRDMRNPGRRPSMCTTGLTTSLDNPSTLLCERSRDGRRQCNASEAPAGGPSEGDQAGDDTGGIDIVCLSEGRIAKAATTAEGAWFSRGSQSACSGSGATNVEGKRCVKSGSTSTLAHGSAVAALTESNTPSKSTLSIDNLSSEAATLTEFYRGVEVEEVSDPGKNGKVSVTVKVCQQFPPLRIADTTRAKALSAANAAVTAGLPCSSFILTHKPAPASITSTLVGNASSEDSTEMAMRHIPFHIMLAGLCGGTEAALPDCVQENFFQRDDDEVWQKQFTTHQQDSERASAGKVRNFPTADRTTFVPDFSPVLQGDCRSTAVDDGLASVLQELLTGRSQGAGAKNVCDVPGALLQQQSVGRALLTRLASLQVQQALLRYTVSLPRSPSQGTTPYHMRTDEQQAQSLHEAVGNRATKSGQGSRLSQFSPGKWPLLVSKEDCSTFAHTRLQQSELFSLMQNHTTCVFHFVIRALCLLANCCPIWAAAGDERAQRSAAANVAYNIMEPPTVAGSRETPQTAVTTSHTPREKYASVVMPVQDGDEPSVSRPAPGNNVIPARKHAESLATPHCKKWILPTNTESSNSTTASEDTSKNVSLAEVAPGGLGGCGGISSYRWHWMHVVSFLTHPELLSVYHSTLAPLLSLFIHNAQSGSGKRCARIESLDTSSSHDDELSMTGEHVAEKAPQSTSQRQNIGTINSSCCGAGSWLVVRQVLCDLDDLRFLHDPSFAPCPQRQDPSFSAHLHQLQMRLGSHSHHASCPVLSQSTPLLCCSAPKCSDQCPGAFYCGTALLRSSIFFRSFLEASRALAVWPQYLAAAAAAALPLPGNSVRCNRSAFLTTDDEGGTTVPCSLERRRHTCASFTTGLGIPTTLAPRAQWHCEQRTDGASTATGESALNMKNDLTDAARGVAACILKHVDLNKLDSTELLALLKLTEEAGSPSCVSPCEERNSGEGETSRAHSTGTLTATPSPVPDCNRSHTSVPPFVQSDISAIPSPADSVEAFKRPCGESKVALQSHDQSQPLRGLCPASTERCPFTGGGCRIVSGGEVPAGHEVSDKLLAAAVSSANLASPAKRTSRCPDDTPSSLLVAEGKHALPEETRKTLLRFSPLFSPRKQQHSIPTPSEFNQNSLSRSKVKPTAVPVPEARGQRQPVKSPLDSFNPSFRNLLCSAVSPESTDGVTCAPSVGHSTILYCNDKGVSRDNLRARETTTRKTSLSLIEPRTLGEAEALELPDSAPRYQHSTASPLRDACASPSFPAAAGATDDSSYKDIAYSSGCRRVEIQRSATFATQELLPETLENIHMSASPGECAASGALEKKFFSLAVAVPPAQHAESEVGTYSGSNRSTGDERDLKEKKGDSGGAVSALDIIERERALSLVAAGVRNTRKRFRLQSVRRKAEARLHYGVNCVTLRTEGSSWDNTTMAHISLQSVSPRQQRTLASPQSPPGPGLAITEASQNSAFCRLPGARVGGGASAGRRRNASGTTPAASGSNNSFNNACHVRSPVKGIYYDSYKKLWRVQWNSCSGAPQHTSTNTSASSVGHGGAGRRVSRSFSCARLGFEAAKARAVAWMLSGGHVGDGGLTDAFQRASLENQASNSTAETTPSGVSGASRAGAKHDPQKNHSDHPAEVQKVADTQDLVREQKEKLLFANPKLFLERVEAFYVRNGLYGLQCGNGPAGGSAERQRSENKEWEEQPYGIGACSSAASQAAHSRKGNGGTGGLRIVSVLSLDDMLDIVQGKKITMSFPYAALKHPPAESRGSTGKSDIAVAAANYSHSCYEDQHQISRNRPLGQEEVANRSSQPCFRDPESNAESARKKSRTRQAVVSLGKEGEGQRRLSKSCFEGKVAGEDAA